MEKVQRRQLEKDKVEYYCKRCKSSFAEVILPHNPNKKLTRKQVKRIKEENKRAKEWRRNFYSRREVDE
ncbi:MAG TPA: hypothetical protein ENI23_09525 [bacterium]|nr:hypothetical protein [bacterium]